MRVNVGQKARKHQGLRRMKDLRGNVKPRQTRSLAPVIIGFALGAGLFTIALDAWRESVNVDYYGRPLAAYQPQSNCVHCWAPETIRDGNRYRCERCGAAWRVVEVPGRPLRVEFLDGESGDVATSHAE